MYVPEAPDSIYEVAPHIQRMICYQTWLAGYNDGLCSRSYATNISDNDAMRVYEIGYINGEETQKLIDEIENRPGMTERKEQREAEAQMKKLEQMMPRSVRILAWLDKHSQLIDFVGAQLNTVCIAIIAYALWRRR